MRRDSLATNTPILGLISCPRYLDDVIGGIPIVGKPIGSDDIISLNPDWIKVYSQVINDSPPSKLTKSIQKHDCGELKKYDTKISDYAS